MGSRVSERALDPASDMGDLQRVVPVWLCFVLVLGREVGGSSGCDNSNGKASRG